MKHSAISVLLLTISASFILLILTISELSHTHAQSNGNNAFTVPDREPLDSGGGSLDLPTDDRGWVLCDPDLRVKGLEHVWAIGDCSVNPAPDGRPYPATAQAAVQQGRAVADNLARVLQGKPTEPCVIKDRGSLVALGCRTGVARIGRLKLAGFPAWFLWRTVYLMKMPGWGRRLRVALEWTIDLVFGRDDVQLGVLFKERQKSSGRDPVKTDTFST